MNWYKLSKTSKVIKLDDVLIGKSDKNDFTEQDANPEEFAIGIQIEKEHTRNDSIARAIALDHLCEIPDYYSRLKKMESDANSKKAFKIERFLRKQASISVYVQGYDYPRKYNDISNLCYYLYDDFWKKIESILTPEEINNWKENGMRMDFFAPDGNDYDKASGIINNYVKAFPPKKIAWLVKYVLKMLKDIGIIVTEVRQETFKDTDEIRVIRYVVGANPKAYEKQDVPDEMNFGGSAAGMTIRLLGGDVNDLPNSFNAQNVIDKIQNYQTGQNLEKELEKTYPPDGLINQNNFDLMVGALSARMDTILNIAKWAVNHGYQEIYFA